MTFLDRLAHQLPQLSQSLDILPLVEQLLNAPDDASLRRLLAERPALLTDLAQQLLATLAAEAQGQGSELVARRLEEQQTLLLQARALGIDAALVRWREDGQVGETQMASHDDFLDAPLELQAGLGEALAAESMLRLGGLQEDLDQAAAAWRRLLHHPAFDGATPAFQLAAWKAAGATLLRRYGASHEADDLGDAQSAWQQAVEQLAPDSADLPACLTYLGHCHQARYDASDDLSALEDAIAAYRHAMSLAQPGARWRAVPGLSLAHSLVELHAATGEASALDQAVDLYRDAASRTPTRRPAELSQVLADLGDALITRFDLAGQPADLDEAVSVYRQAVQASAPGAAAFPPRTLRLGKALLARYELNRSQQDLEEAIAVLQGAAALAPAGSRDLPAIGGALSLAMQAVYRQAGVL